MINKQDWSTYKRLLFMQASGGSVVEATATGNPLSFTTDVAKPLKSLVLPWTPVQSGTGDPSPENVRPISGVSALTVYHSGQDTSNPTTYPIVFPALGKNLLDITQTSKVVPGAQGSTITIANGVISIDAVANSARSYVVFSQTFPAGTYTIQAKNSGAVSMPRLLCSKEFSGASLNTYYGMYMKQLTANELKFTVSESCVIGLVLSNSAGEAGSPGTLYDIMLNTGESAQTYEPYTNTVYGGSLDVVSGVLTATHLLFSANTSTMNNSENYPGWKNAGVSANNAKGGTFTNAIVNVGKSYSINVNSGNDIIYLAKDYYSNMTQSEWVSLAIDVQIVYELATAKTWQLDANTITAIIGDNVLWSDTNGTNEAVYLKKG